MRRVVPYVFIVAAILLAATGVYDGFLQRPPEPRGFTVEAPEGNLGDFPVGKSVLTWRFTNNSKEARRIIGLAEK